MTTAVQLTTLITPSEKEWTAQIIQLLHLRGFLVTHFRPARRADGTWATPLQADGAGFPDIIATKGTRLLAIELKTDKGRLEPLQQRWLTALGACDGVETFVWRPRDFDRICEVLA